MSATWHDLSARSSEPLRESRALAQLSSLDVHLKDELEAMIDALRAAHRLRRWCEARLRAEAGRQRALTGSIQSDLERAGDVLPVPEPWPRTDSPTEAA